MKKEVLNEKDIKEYLLTNYDLYSIYEFADFEQLVRTKYNNKVNPEFIILDRSNNIVHRFIGYFEVNSFKEQLVISFTDGSLSAFDSLYIQGYNTPDFYYNYVRVKQNANQLDSALIFEYLNSLSQDQLMEELFFKDLLNYGFYRGKMYISYNSDYYKILSRTYIEKSFPELNEAIRVRLLTLLLTEYYKSSSAEEKFNFIDRMILFENGNDNYLKDIYSPYVYSVIPDRYVSFNLRYESISTDDQASRNELLQNHLNRIGDDPDELNSIAWGIYLGQYDYPISVGFDLIKRSLGIKESAYSLDTYASLLYKNEQYDEALIIANKALEMTNPESLNYIDTKKLVNKISKALGLED